VFANEIHIHQIIINLCTNASHAMKVTGGRLTVTMTATEIQAHDAQSFPAIRPGKYLRLSVADTGCGIPPEVLNRIFDPYFTTKPIGEGTGMGLATVHGIVKDHGGIVEVYSEPGVGSTFHVFLPIADTKAEPTAEVATELPGGNECILFVDDEKAIIDLGRSLLERLGYRVETRASSIDAIEAFRADPKKYDLVVSDMNMPEIAGDEMLRAMKAIRPSIPTILCSGFISERIHTQAEALGVQAVLMKPVIYADLAYTIRQVLKK
jgi:CheY-like chemotaxis protein